MSNRSRKRCSRGMVDVVLTGVAGGQTFTWRDPGTIGAASPTQIELEYIPTTIIHNRTAQGGTPGAYVIVPTVTGGTISLIGNYSL